MSNQRSTLEMAKGKDKTNRTINSGLYAETRLPWWAGMMMQGTNQA
jgi:hypothetical protein